MSDYIATYNSYNLGHRSLFPFKPLLLVFIKDSKKMSFGFVPNKDNLLDPKMKDFHKRNELIFLGKTEINLLDDGTLTMLGDGKPR